LKATALNRELKLLSNKLKAAPAKPKENGENQAKTAEQNENGKAEMDVEMKERNEVSTEDGGKSIKDQQQEGNEAQNDATTAKMDTD
jgi:hypothetical protein